MQRDVKIGIAIGVLLIALVAIFMWTRRDLPQPLMPAGYEAARTQLPPAEEPVAPIGLGPEAGLFGPREISASEVPMPAPPGAIRGTGGTSFEPPRGATDSVGTVPPRQAPAGQSSTDIPPPAIATRKHTVAAKESLSKIAARYYGKSTQANIDRIHKANRLVIGPDANKLKVGMKLIIPNIPASGTLVPVAIRTTTTQPTAVQKHTVAAKESLSKIAARYYGTATKANIDRIHEANRAIIGSDANKIKKGMKLIIPNIPASGTLVPVVIRTTTTQPTAVQKHTVAASESLSKIAARYYGTATKANIDRIHDANRSVIGSDANKIKKGMVLTIPPKE